MRTGNVNHPRCGIKSEEGVRSEWTYLIGLWHAKHAFGVRRLDAAFLKTSLTKAATMTRHTHQSKAASSRRTPERFAQNIMEHALKFASFFRSQNSARLQRYTQPCGQGVRMGNEKSNFENFLHFYSCPIILPPFYGARA